MSNQKWPCIFTTEFTKNEVNKRLFQRYPKFNFNAFTRAWRWEHCATINPYGSESCPYVQRDCALAYMITAQRAMDGATRSEVGYFKLLARKSAAQRADDKPLARDRVATTGRTDGLQERSDGLRTGAGTRSADDLGVPAVQGPTFVHRLPDDEPRSLRRAAPRSLGSLLGADDPRSRPPARRGDKRETSTDNHGHGGDALLESPSGQLGRDAQAPIEGVHSESE